MAFYSIPGSVWDGETMASCKKTYFGFRIAKQALPPLPVYPAGR